MTARVTVMVPMAETEVDADRWARVVVMPGDNHDRSRRDADGLLIDDYWRMANRRRGSRHGIDRRRMQGVADDMDRRHAGEHLADCGPFTVASGGGRDSGGSEGGET